MRREDSGGRRLPELLSGAEVRPPSSRPAWATLFRIDRAVGSNSLGSGTDAQGPTKMRREDSGGRRLPGHGRARKGTLPLPRRAIDRSED